MGEAIVSALENNPNLDAAKQRETAEMMGKLKDLGNQFLGASLPPRCPAGLWLKCAGNFGLSTDNFKFEPNGQGGYSVGFTQ